MGEGSAELVVTGELERGKALVALSVLFTVMAGIACVVCLAHMGLTVGLAPLPPPAPPPAPPSFKLLLKEMTWWSTVGV